MRFDLVYGNEAEERHCGTLVAEACSGRHVGPHAGERRRRFGGPSWGGCWSRIMVPMWAACARRIPKWS